MPLSNKRILIVEDNSQNRVIYQMMLLKAHARVTFDRWGHDTPGLMQRLAPYDLIILNLMLPMNQTGYDTFEEIRHVDKFASIPIVAVSAADPSTAIPKARSMGFNGSLPNQLMMKCLSSN